MFNNIEINDLDMLLKIPANVRNLETGFLHSQEVKVELLKTYHFFTHRLLIM